MNESPTSPKGQAYHEAGHVVFGVLAGKRLRSVAIRLGESQGDGCAQWDVTLPKEGALTIEQVKPECVTLLAGRVVEEWFCPPSSDHYASHFSDLAQVTKLFDRVSDASEDEYKNAWIEEIRNALRRDEVKRAVESVATRLLEASTLTGVEATALVHAHRIENL